ncbi:hypothetical protein GO986_12285 [Deinococcus sp. HMF7620]|uniref:Uncharacterized protein n=1 Tax=Deinococcus arboris TaxID=2682977 RepID=A0A7C9MRV8_9DEIO|nr:MULTISPECIES: hypothetical protein [Deinococcus]MBZ9752202.1 hypothetical protein [Deinococcus betulae]MVN87544.1 hypothetical protein [Deinococcus arboris]
MKRFGVVLTLLLSPTASAQTSMQVPVLQAATLIERAQNSLLIYAPTMQNSDVTSAYRKALVRQVATVIITTPQAVQKGGRNERVVQVAFAGYDTQVAKLYAPKITNAAESVPFVVVDEAFALVGTNLTQVPLPGDPVSVSLVRDPKVVASLAQWVKSNARANPPVDLQQWLAQRLKRP